MSVAVSCGTAGSVEGVVKLSKKDYESDQEVRWCAGCGDYAILAAMQKLLADLQAPREKHVFVSGIGCSSRFPYYMNTYGFHTIHGRAPAIASGLKIANPDLHVWVVTGDGDALSIGGNHFLHVLRRNINVKILLFNNRIYGLTKGQYSPTSELGKVTKSTPFGSLDVPIDPVTLALAAKATFVARSSATDVKHLTHVLRAAHEHRGTAMIEILQNCPVFNDGAFDDITERDVKESAQLEVRHGEPLLFGKERKVGITIDGFTPRVIAAESESSPVVRYDENNRHLASLIASLPFPEFPVPLGVLYREERAVYEQSLHEQIQETTKKLGQGDLKKLLHGGDSWTVS